MLNSVFGYFHNYNRSIDCTKKSMSATMKTNPASTVLSIQCI